MSGPALVLIYRQGLIWVITFSAFVIWFSCIGFFWFQRQTKKKKCFLLCISRDIPWCHTYHRAQTDLYKLDKRHIFLVHTHISYVYCLQEMISIKPSKCWNFAFYCNNNLYIFLVKTKLWVDIMNFGHVPEAVLD